MPAYIPDKGNITLMKNPWEDWQDAAVLEEDVEKIKKCNKDIREQYEVKTDGLVPFPFFGDPEKAVVWLLLSTPGFRDVNFTEHRSIEFRKAAKLSLQHKGLHPYLSDKFKDFEGNKWWARVLKDVLAEFPSDEHPQVFEKLMCVQMLPYHAQEFSGPAQKAARELSSWCYSHQLVRKAINGGKLVIVMRAPWRDVLQEEFGKPLCENHTNIICNRFARGVPPLNSDSLANGKFHDVVAELQKALRKETVQGV